MRQSIALFSTTTGNWWEPLALPVTSPNGKQAEEELAKSKTFLTAAIECLPFEFFALAPDGHCILQNAVSRQYYGNAVGKTAEEVCPDEHILPRWLAKLSQVMGGKRISEEVELTGER